MASIAIMAGTALVNALAFSGTNAAFSLLGDHGGTEMKRHNLAVERLSKVREDWNRDRQQRLTRLSVINGTTSTLSEASMKPCKSTTRLQVNSYLP